MIQFSRMTFAAFGILAASSAFDAAQADPYRWCADYTVLGGIGARPDPLAVGRRPRPSHRRAYQGAA